MLRAVTSGWRKHKTEKKTLYTTARRINFVFRSGRTQTDVHDLLFLSFFFYFLGSSGALGLRAATVHRKKQKITGRPLDDVELTDWQLELAHDERPDPWWASCVLNFYYYYYFVVVFFSFFTRTPSTRHPAAKGF